MKQQQQSIIILFLIIVIIPVSVAYAQEPYKELPTIRDNISGYDGSLEQALDITASQLLEVNKEHLTQNQYHTDKAEALYQLGHKDKAKQVLRHSYNLNNENNHTLMLMQQWGIDTNS